MSDYGFFTTGQIRENAAVITVQIRRKKDLFYDMNPTPGNTVAHRRYWRTDLLWDRTLIAINKRATCFRIALTSQCNNSPSGEKQSKGETSVVITLPDPHFMQFFQEFLIK